MSKKILILNAALNGKDGNSVFVANKISKLIKEKNFEIIDYSLKEELEKNSRIQFKQNTKNIIDSVDAIVFLTGTYWDSWSSHAQIFFEEMTEFEGSKTFLGKPVICIVTMHSVGGKGILSRLQGIFNTLGMLIPPMSGLVYSLANQEAIKTENTFAEDLWSLDDLPFIVNNLTEALKHNANYSAWPFDKKDPRRKWINDDEV